MSDDKIEKFDAVPGNRPGTSRRSFIKKTSIFGATGALGLSGVMNLAAGDGDDRDDRDDDHRQAGGLTRGDLEILIAAEIAEALAVTTYTNIINTSPFFGRIPSDDQGYLAAARQEEMSHYLLEQSASGHPSPYKTFYYPPDMFADTQTTLNVLVTLEDAFIAAYLVGVRRFSTPDLRVTAARIMGIESDHRTLARVIGPDVSSTDGGPIAEITGFAGKPESVAPPNNNGYERTLCWTEIKQAVEALTPFVDPTAAKAAGFDTTKAFDFVSFTPTLPSALGAFTSYSGC
jgi:hypothetical protein